MNRFRPLGSTGLQCHLFGFGSYRVMNGDEKHESALRRYLGSGGNLIDTSANYGDGSSEELVGKVLQGIHRERAIIVTKGGYIQGRNMTLAQQSHFPEVVEYGPGIWHCIHPEFLETQISLSRERLQQKSLDVYLLHNPEYFLEDIAHRRRLTAEDHDEFYRRIREAFRFLEVKVSEGAIGWYGVSSNNFAQPAFPPSLPTTMTSVSRCLAEAEAVSDNHHFRVVQLPLNLYEPGAALEPNNDGRTALEFCRENGIGVLANRPLNAFHNNQMTRLVDWAKPGAASPGTEALRELGRPVARVEDKFRQTTGMPFRLSTGETVSELIQRIVPQVQNPFQWQQVGARQVVEPIQAWFKSMRPEFEKRPEWQELYQELAGEVNNLLRGVGVYLAAREQRESDAIRSRLEAAGYPHNEQPLSRRALHIVASLPGLSAVLVGMRKPSYVDDVLEVLKLEEMDGRDVLHQFTE